MCGQGWLFGTMLVYVWMNPNLPHLGARCIICSRQGAWLNS